MIDGLRVTKQQFVERMRESSKDDELPRVKSPSSDIIFFALQYVALEKAGFVLVDKQELCIFFEKEHALRKLWQKRPRFTFNKEKWKDSTGEPISDEVAEYWFADFDKGFSEGFSSEKSSSLLVAEKEASPRKCPLCKTIYSMDIDLQELWMDERKIYQCKNRNATHEFCEHVLVAIRKDIGHFSCQNCSSSIDECDCFDCMMVFCGQCNSFINLTCSDVVQMMDINEETKKHDRK